MSRIVQLGARKLPTMLGAGILGIAFVGLGAAAFGITLSLLGEGVAAVTAMVAAARFA